MFPFSSIVNTAGLLLVYVIAPFSAGVLVKLSTGALSVIFTSCLSIVTIGFTCAFAVIS